MATVHKYRVWCDTDSQHEYVWAETEPTTCPANPAHTIDNAKTSIMQTVADEDVTVTNTVHTDKSLDTLSHIYVHDFCKPWTWYQESTQVVDETLNAVGGETEMVLANSDVIWLKGRDLMNSHLITTYDLDVRINDVAQTEQDYVHYKNLWTLDSQADDWANVPGDYYFDRANNKIVFKNALAASDVVKVTYYHVDSGNANRSRFRITPPAGYYYKIEMIEVDFSSDIKLRDTAIFQLWAANGTSLQMDKRYYKMDNYRSDSIRPNPTTTSCGGTGERGMAVDGRTYTWDYISAFPIKDSAVMWLDVFLEHNEVFGGDNATVTVYTKLIAE